MQTPHFFIDLDETLVASNEDVSRLSLRPGAHTFLIDVRLLGPVFLFTAANKAHADYCIDYFGLGGLFDERFYNARCPTGVIADMNFLVDDQALTAEDISENCVTRSWLQKSKKFSATLVPIYVASYEIEFLKNDRPNLEDALQAIYAKMNGEW